MRPRRLGRLSRALVVGAVVAMGAGGIYAGVPYQIGQSALAHTYYVSPAGSDANNGLSEVLPFRTIGACSALMGPGDTCVIEEGTYHETLRPAQSGSAGRPITYRSAPGASVTLAGDDVISSTWTLQSGAIYTTSITLPISGYQANVFGANQVFVDGAMLDEARWPQNTGTLLAPTEAVADSGTDFNQSTIVDAALSVWPTNALVGATLHVRGGFAWIAQTGVVQSNTQGTTRLTYSGANSGNLVNLGPKAGNAYYVTGMAGETLLTYPGAWAAMPLTHTLAVWLPGSDAPSAHVISVKQRPWAIDLSDRSFVTVQGLTLHAASITTTATSASDVFSDLTVLYPTHFVTIPPGASIFDAHRFDSGVVLSGTNMLLQHSSVAYSAGNGVLLDGALGVVTDTVVHDADYDQVYAPGIMVRTTPAGGALVAHNTVYNTARDGIQVVPTAGRIYTTTITGNDVFNYTLLNMDSGGVYICCNDDGTGSVIDHNWFHDQYAGANPGIGAHQGAGIYLDTGSSYFLVHHNATWNTNEVGLRLNPGTTGNYTNANLGNRILNNTVDGTATASLDGGPISGGAQSINNIYGAGAVSGGFTRDQTNLGSMPAVVDAAHHNYFPAAGSAALGTGTPLGGITPEGDTAPDIGAYQSTEPLWVPGCTFSRTLCADPYVPWATPN